MSAKQLKQGYLPLEFISQEQCEEELRGMMRAPGFWFLDYPDEVLESTLLPGTTGAMWETLRDRIYEGKHITDVIPKEKWEFLFKNCPPGQFSWGVIRDSIEGFLYGDIDVSGRYSFYIPFKWLSEKELEKEIIGLTKCKIPNFPKEILDYKASVYTVQDFIDMLKDYDPDEPFYNNVSDFWLGVSWTNIFGYDQYLATQSILRGLVFYSEDFIRLISS